MSPDFLGSQYLFSKTLIRVTIFNFLGPEKWPSTPTLAATIRDEYTCVKSLLKQVAPRLASALPMRIWGDSPKPSWARLEPLEGKFWS